MPKIKIPRKSTNIDMTAMCDVAFLLLTFFMLATKFKPDEPVVVQTPNSISQIPIPDVDIMLITLDKNGRIFFSIDNKNMRMKLIDAVNDANGLNLSKEAKTSFAIGSSIGVPISQLAQYLNAPTDQQKQFDQTAKGIPVDTAITKQNELAQWISDARQISGNALRVCIKADGDVSYPNYRNIIRTLEGLKIFKFNLITGLKEVPQGTAAWEKQQQGISGAEKK